MAVAISATSSSAATSARPRIHFPSLNYTNNPDDKRCQCPMSIVDRCSVRMILHPTVDDGRRRVVCRPISSIVDRQNDTTYTVTQILLIAAVLYLPFVFRFFALRAKNEKQRNTKSTLLPQAKGRPREPPRMYCQNDCCISLHLAQPRYPIRREIPRAHSRTLCANSGIVVSVKWLSSPETLTAATTRLR